MELPNDYYSVLVTGITRYLPARKREGGVGRDLTCETKYMYIIVYMCAFDALALLFLVRGPTVAINIQCRLRYRATRTRIFLERDLPARINLPR